MKVVITLLFIVTFSFSNTQEKQDIDDLIGIWKIENKDTYEIWSKTDNGNLIGISYKITNGQKHIKETLLIKKVKGLVLFEAKVLNQNKGKPVSFTLNTKIKSSLTFENANHDFPKKIKYKKINNNKLFVEVLGDNNKGFSYLMIRSKEPKIIPN